MITRLCIIFFMGTLLSLEAFCQRSRVTQRSERTGISNMMLRMFTIRNWWQGDLPHIASPGEFCPTLPTFSTHNEYVDVKPGDLTEIPSSLEVLVAVASQFNRKTVRGRTKCNRAISNWYQQNSMWAEYSKKERIERTFTLMEEQKIRLEREENYRFHPDFDVSIVACIGRQEDNSYYPETASVRICNKYCNNNLEGVNLSPEAVSLERSGRNCVALQDDEEHELQKVLSIGMGQVIPQTFWGWNNPPPPGDGYANTVGFVDDNEGPHTSKAFGRLGERPDMQVAMKLIHINDNLKLDYLLNDSLSLKVFRDKFLGKCFHENTPQWLQAVAYYNGHEKSCPSYVQKVGSCRKRCFDETENREQIINCLLKESKEY